jgi:hypothetical protein
MAKLLPSKDKLTVKSATISMANDMGVRSTCVLCICGEVFRTGSMAMNAISSPFKVAAVHDENQASAVRNKTLQHAWDSLHLHRAASAARTSKTYSSVRAATLCIDGDMVLLVSEHFIGLRHISTLRLHPGGEACKQAHHICCQQP